jgi:hypothetical protein
MGSVHRTETSPARKNGVPAGMILFCLFFDLWVWLPPEKNGVPDQLILFLLLFRFIRWLALRSRARVVAIKACPL